MSIKKPEIGSKRLTWQRKLLISIFILFNILFSIPLVSGIYLEMELINYLIYGIALFVIMIISLFLINIIKKRKVR